MIDQIALDLCVSGAYIELVGDAVSPAHTHTEPPMTTNIQSHTAAFQQGNAIGSISDHTEETSCRANPYDRGSAEWHEWYAGWYLGYSNKQAAEHEGVVPWSDAWRSATDLGRYLIARVKAHAILHYGDWDGGDIAFSWSCVCESEAYEDDKLLAIIGTATTPEEAIEAVRRDLMCEFDEEPKPYWLNEWGSNPNEGNDDCWTGTDFATIEQTREALKARLKSGDLDISHFEITGPGEHGIYKNPSYDEARAKRLAAEDDANWRNEQAMQAGMAGGCAAYNEAMEQSLESYADGPIDGYDY